MDRDDRSCLLIASHEGARAHKLARLSLNCFACSFGSCISVYLPSLGHSFRAPCPMIKYVKKASRPAVRASIPVFRGCLCSRKYFPPCGMVSSISQSRISRSKSLRSQHSAFSAPALVHYHRIASSFQAVGTLANNNSVPAISSSFRARGVSGER
jgi:hypothetical protein